MKIGLIIYIYVILNSCTIFTLSNIIGLPSIENN
jgi:hypothetical protein